MIMMLFSCGAAGDGLKIWDTELLRSRKKREGEREKERKKGREKNDLPI